MKKEIDNIIVVHHNWDNDGFMSGVIALNMYRAEVQSGFVKLYGYGYEESHPFMEEVSQSGNTNKLFQFIDVTPTCDWLLSIKEELTNGTISVQIFDHHQLKYEDIQNLQLPGIDYHFDNGFCGAYIYYNHWKQLLNGNLLNNDNVSTLFDAKIHFYIEHIDAYDTWKFNQYESTIKKNEVLAFNEFFSLHQSVTAFDMAMLTNPIQEIIKKGMVIVEYKTKKEVPSQLKKAFLTKVQYVSDVKFPLLMVSGSSSYFSQKVLNEHFAGHLMGIIYYNIDLKKKEVSLSIRSNIPNTIDCAVVARKFNPTGGGHKEAAGCTLPLDTFFELFVADETWESYINRIQEIKHIKHKLEILQSTNVKE